MVSWHLWRKGHVIPWNETQDLINLDRTSNGPASNLLPGTTEGYSQRKKTRQGSVCRSSKCGRTGHHSIQEQTVGGARKRAQLRVRGEAGRGGAASWEESRRARPASAPGPHHRPARFHMECERGANGKPCTGTVLVRMKITALLTPPRQGEPSAAVERE